MSRQSDGDGTQPTKNGGDSGIAAEVAAVRLVENASTCAVQTVSGNPLFEMETSERPLGSHYSPVQARGWACNPSLDFRLVPTAGVCRSTEY